MALLRCQLFSDALQVGVPLTVLLPQPTQSQIGVSGTGGDGPPPVLYLLHGLSDDDSAWTRYTSVERYAEEAGLAVVMPAVGRSFYLDMAHGGRYWTYLTHELPDLVRRFFRVSTAREDTFVAGLSMGGYGALRWALHQPERFAAAASLSGALDLASLDDAQGLAPDVVDAVTGGRPVRDTDDDLLAVLDRLDVARLADLPALHVSCGTDDALLGQSERFVAHARARGLDVQVDLRPGGHEWGLWDAVIQDVLAWLPQRASFSASSRD